MKETLEEMFQEVTEIGKEADVAAISERMDSKLALIHHLFMGKPEDREDRELPGLSFIIEDVREDLAQLIKFATEAQSYIYYKNNPQSLEEIVRLNEITGTA